MIKVIVSVSVVIIAMVLIFKLPSFAKAIDIRVSVSEFISSQLKYQLLLLALAVFTLVAVYLVSGENMVRFLSLGEVSAPAKPVPILGIKENESWLSLGISLSFFITLITVIFVYFQVKGSDLGWEQLAPMLGWVLLFSLMNSFSEEAIFRLGLVGSLHEVISPSNIMFLSAVIFGLAHYRGMPSGVVGMLMAGILGWLLMKSVLETHGIFWAWFIHLLQDVVIFSGLILLNIKPSTPQLVS